MVKAPSIVESSSSSTPLGLIAGVVIGAIVLIVIAALLIRKRRRKVDPVKAASSSSSSAAAAASRARAQSVGAKQKQPFNSYEDADVGMTTNPLHHAYGSSAPKAPAEYEYEQTTASAMYDVDVTASSRSTYQTGGFNIPLG